MATWGSRRSTPLVWMYSQAAILRSTSNSCGHPSFLEGVLRSLSLGMITLFRLSLTWVNSWMGSISALLPVNSKRKLDSQSKGQGRSTAATQNSKFLHFSRQIQGYPIGYLMRTKKKSKDTCFTKETHSQFRPPFCIRGLCWWRFIDVVSMRRFYTLTPEFRPCVIFKMKLCWLCTASLAFS